MTTIKRIALVAAEEQDALMAQLVEALDGLVAWADDLRRDDPVEDLRKARAALKSYEESK